MSFEPPDRNNSSGNDVKQIESIMQNHRLVQSLGANSSLFQTRFYAEIPETTRNSLFTYRDLLGSTRITIDPLAFWDKGSQSIALILHLGHGLAGWSGIIHGGLLATMLDEALARCAWLGRSGSFPVTTHLDVKFQHPAPADEFYILEAKLVRLNGSSGWVEGCLRTLDQDTTTLTKYLPSEAVATARAEYRYIKLNTSL